VFCGAFAAIEDKKRKWKWQRTRYVCFLGWNGMRDGGVAKSRLEALVHHPRGPSGPVKLNCCGYRDAGMPV